jgi:peroxiredoxin
VGQLGELARFQDRLTDLAEVYVINPDTPERARELRKHTGLRLPLLLDPPYKTAAVFDLRGLGRPMAGLVGFIVIDPDGVIRVQRVDIQFGRRVPFILGALRSYQRR